MLFNDYEIPSNYHFHIFQRLLPWTPVFFISFGWILALGLVGLLSRRKLRTGTPAFFACVYLFSALAIHIQARYRFPLVPVLILMAAFGTIHLVETLKNRRWVRATALVA